jgi:hypothetical protein
MSGEPGRIEIFSAVLILTGAILLLRSAGRLLSVTRARFTYGAPYREGMIVDRLLGLAMTLPVLLLGLGLAFLAWGQWGFQSNEGTIRVAQIEARRSDWGKVSVRVVPDPRYPVHEPLQGEVAGARWAVAGDFITWSPGVRWLGLHNGHRVRYLIGTRDTTGTSPTLGDQTHEIDRLPPGAAVLVRAARYIPFLTVRVEASPWFPITGHQVMTLYAIGPGYLADVASD